ncbi:hypothetical protein PSY49_23480, partial [Shigella flexneri]|nr:hypothetical protein [Shigella flexneri]
ARTRSCTPELLPVSLCRRLCFWFFTLLSVAVSAFPWAFSSAVLPVRARQGVFAGVGALPCPCLVAITVCFLAFI